VAATAYARLQPWRDEITRVVLLGPAHRVPVRSMAVSSADGWDTPLGRVPVDGDGRAVVAGLPGVEVDDEAHGPEHSLEVELPFLQRALTGPFSVLPIVVGHAPVAEVAAVLDAVWGGDETLVVISSDLSHYEDYATAADHDRRTADNILAGRLDAIGPHDACGAFGVRGLLAAARARRLDIELVDLRSSGDTAGPPDRVVGYGSFVLSASTPAGGAAWAVGGPAAATAEVVMTTSSPAPVAEPAPLTGDDLTAEDRALVLDVALEAVRATMEDRPPRPVEAAPAHLAAPAATFVTLRDGRRLLGCIGSMEAGRPLLEDVADNAVGAAFRDPRMPALTPFEFARMSVHVSVLSPPEPMGVSSRDELRAAVVPGRDGLLVEAGRKRGTFLPAVWEQLREVDDFLDQLWHKAGLAPGSWPARLRVWRYRAAEFGVEGPREAPAGPST
jgi:AmmeMemoRadiSam system protein B/AmmeMemoRadiSam system protein A